MAEFTGELNLNSRRKPVAQIKTGDLKGGIKRSQLAPKYQAIFDAVNNKDASKGNVDDILDANEMNAFWEKLKEFAKNDKLSGREAKKLIKDLGLQDISKEDLFNFVNEIYGASEDIESSSVDDDGTIIINYKEDENGTKLEERISTDKTSELIENDKDGNSETTYLDANGKTKQFITKNENGDTETYTYTDADGNVVLDAEGKEVIVKYEALQNSGTLKTTINYDNGQEHDATVVEGALTSKYEYIDGKPVLKQAVENRGNDVTVTTDYVYNEDNTITATTQEAQYLKTLGLKDTKGAGKKYTDKAGKTYTIVGNAAYERTIVKDKAGNFHVFAHDGEDLKLEYVGNDIAFSNSDEYIRVVRGGKARYIEKKDRDAHGRHNMIDWRGNNVGVLAGQNQKGKPQVDLENRAVLDPVYLEGSDKNDKGELARSYANGITYYQKDGKTFYFKPPVNGVGGFIDTRVAEGIIASDICENSRAAAKGMGTDNEKFQKAAAGIITPSIMARVNKKLAGTEFDKNNGYSAYENLILDENNHGTAQEKYFQVMVNNGAYTPAEAARLGRKEIAHEISRGGTEGIKRSMRLINSPQARRILESSGFDIRTSLKNKGNSDIAINRIEAVWVENGAYEAAVLKLDENGKVVYNEDGNPVYLRGGDQADRNRIIGSLLDDGTLESRNIALTAIDTDNITTRGTTADYEFFLEKAAEINNKNGAKVQFKGQDAGQVYLAWVSSDYGHSASFDLEDLTAYNARLFNDIQPARVRAEMSMYNARQDGMTAIFLDNDPEVLAEVSKMLENGEVNGCKNFQDVYLAEYNKVKGDYLKTLDLHLAAIASKTIDFDDESVIQTVVAAMYALDHNSATLYYKEKRDEIFVLIDEIIASHPELKDQINQRIADENLTHEEYYTGLGHLTKSRVDRWQFHVNDIVNDHGVIAVNSKEYFFDENHNRITDPQTIEAIKQANLNNLSELRTLLAQLERELNIAAADEGCLSSLGRSIGSANVDGRLEGTYYEDLMAFYKYAHSKLSTMEQAANGTLQDAKGNIISYNDMQNQMREYLDRMAKRNNDFKTTGMYAKMGVILAPVVVGTMAVSGGTSSVVWGGVFAGGATYTLNTIEYSTSRTGYTTERQESNFKESAVAAVSTWLGGAYAKGAYAIETGNSALNVLTRGGVIFAGDVGSSVAAEQYLTGNVSKEGTILAGALSIVGNGAALKNLAASKAKLPNPAPSTPVLTKATSHQAVAGGDVRVANSSSVRVGKPTAGQIEQEVNALLSNPNTSVSDLAARRNQLNALSDSEFRSSQIRKIGEAVTNLSPDQQAEYSRLVHADQLEEAERIVNGKGYVREADGRALREYTSSTEDISELAALRDKIDVRRPGGKFARDIFDDRIAALRKANRTPSQIGESVHQQLDNAIANKKGLGDFNDLKTHIQATTDPAELNNLFNKWMQIRRSCGFTQKSIDKLFKDKGLNIAKPNNRLAETPVEPVAPAVKPSQGDNFGIRPVDSDPQVPYSNEFLNEQFNTKLQNSGIWRTAGKTHTVERLGGEKLSRYTQEFDDLCRYATTPEQLNELQALANKFSGQAENTSFSASIARRRAELNGGSVREIYTDPHTILVNEQQPRIVIEPYTGNNTFRLT